MNKKLLFMGALALGLAFTSCSKDDDTPAQKQEEKTDSISADTIPEDTIDEEITVDEAQNMDYTSENAKAWGNYAANVALLLQQDAQTLYDKWNGGFAAAFKAHNGETSSYTSAEACIEQVIDGCSDIANEVGESKIGEPYNLYTGGHTTDALYAVESWYSWHSRDDYKNNILSIANSLVGKRLTNSPSEYDYKTLAQNVMAGTAEFGPNIMEQCMKAGYSDGDKTLMANAITVWQDVCAAWTAIDNIPQPFRNNIGSKEAEEAMTACANLVDALSTLKESIAKNNTIKWEETVNNYVDVVVVPTYKELAEKNKALYNAVVSFQANPSNAAFEACCTAWLSARAPWETSEAFLFGPVSELGLDPNMDSWPLDAVGIANTLLSENWSAMDWSGDYDEESEAIEAAQSVRGFHTLEFLIFKNGNPRTVK